MLSRKSLNYCQNKNWTVLGNFKSNTMKTRKISTFDEHLDKEYGPEGSISREKFEEGYESFKLGVLIRELRQKQNLTQDQLARKCNTTKNYISRIENDASDVRLSTIKRIVKEGLGGRLKLTVEVDP